MKKYSAEEKAKHVEACRASGLSQKTYCEQQGLKYKTFKNWLSKPKQVTAVPAFIPAQLKANPSRLSNKNQIMVLFAQEVSLLELVEVLKTWSR
jgi:transposase